MQLVPQIIPSQWSIKMMCANSHALKPLWLKAKWQMQRNKLMYWWISNRFSICSYATWRKTAGFVRLSNKSKFILFYFVVACLTVINWFSIQTGNRLCNNHIYPSYLIDALVYKFDAAFKSPFSDKPCVSQCTFNFVQKK
jgi:hypothetical protein